MEDDSNSRRTLVDRDVENAVPSSEKKQEQPPQIDPYLVFFKRNDPECPFYWPLWKKWLIVVTIGVQIIWIAGLGASWSPANYVMAEEFGTSGLVMRIPQAMYLVGFSFGPVLLSPVAEDYGRRYTFTLCLLGTYIFQIPIALAPNYATLVVCRFIAGFIASPIFNSVCNIPDLWSNTDEFIPGLALNFWAFCAELIVIAPLWGAYMTANLGWRWLWGTSALVGAALCILFVAIVPETRHTVLLSRRAAKLRRETGDDRYYADGAISGHRPIPQILRETLYRPVWMLLSEPIVNLTALYDGLNYALIFLLVESVPLVYELHNFSDPGVEFIFFSVVVGYLIAIAIWPYQWYLSERLNKRRGEIVPEGKLLWGFVAAVGFPVSLYLFAWLSIPSIHWFAGLPALALFGAVSHILFLMISDYTVQSYQSLASSAVTGQSFARELISATFIIVGSTIYERVGYPEMTTILASIAVVLGVVVPLFYVWGPKIRERSNYSQEIKAAARKEAERARMLEAMDASQ